MCLVKSFKVKEEEKRKFNLLMNLLRQFIHSTNIYWVICCCSVTQSCPTLCDPMDCSMPGFPVLHHLLEFAQTHVHWVGDAIQPSPPLSFPSPPAIFPSIKGIFQWVSLLHQVAKVLEFQFQHQSFNEYSGSIFFRMDWLDLLAVQGTLKSLLQHTVWKHQFFRAQPSLWSTTSIRDYW